MSRARALPVYLLPPKLLDLKGGFGTSEIPLRQLTWVCVKMKPSDLGSHVTGGEGAL